MDSFATIRTRAEDRKGGPDAIRKILEDPNYIIPPRDVGQMTDDRILSEFSKRVFQAGFNWKVIETKWPGFEEAFAGFDIGRNAMMSDEDLDRHLQNTAIVRHAAKILSVRDNAVFLQDLAREHGSAAKCLGDWPSSDIVTLWGMMKKRGTRLGGTTGQYALRFMGKDSFILSKSVVAGLNRAGVIDGAASSKTAQRKAQDAFNAWVEESGETYSHVSRMLALSVPD